MNINTNQTIYNPIMVKEKGAKAEEKGLTGQDRVDRTPSNNYDVKWEEFSQKMKDLEKTEKYRKAAIMGGTVTLGAALGAAGGLVTGVAGAVIGGVSGLLGGITAGAVAGAAIGDLIEPNAGPGALAYVGVGMFVGAGIGLIGGAIAGYGASSVIGGVSGALGGAYLGHTLHYSNETRLMNKIEKEVFGK